MRPKMLLTIWLSSLIGTSVVCKTSSDYSRGQQNCSLTFQKKNSILELWHCSALSQNRGRENEDYNKTGMYECNCKIITIDFCFYSCNDWYCEFLLMQGMISRMWGLLCSCFCGKQLPNLQVKVQFLLGVICKEVALTVLHCFDQWNDSTH